MCECACVCVCVCVRVREERGSLLAQNFWSLLASSSLTGLSFFFKFPVLVCLFFSHQQ